MKSVTFNKERIFKTIQVFFLLIGIILFTACCKEEKVEPKPISTSINKILPLGASRVEGFRPNFESYRYELWKSLVTAGWEFDYIGTMTDEASYENFRGLPFDKDHEGRGGWTSVLISENLSDWLVQTGSPDVVLFSSPGGNDALENLPYNQTITKINEIIDILQANNPNVTIIIEKLAPGRSDLMTPQFTTYFTNLQRDVVTIASEQSTATSKVIVVDIATGFSDALLADDVHYNEAGAKFVAERYYTILEDVLKK